MTYQLAKPERDPEFNDPAHKVIEALAPRTRWEIFSHLSRRPYSVGEMARILPVSRPAVSQHLKVLKEVGLVHEEARGVRRIYRADPKALMALRHWLDGFWDQALDNMKQLMETEDD